MNEFNSKEKKIKDTFDSFFDAFGKTTWRPSDIKNYKRSLYNTLCREYKGENDKINRENILAKFASKQQKETFEHTKIYDKKGIKKEFEHFFDLKRKKGESTWTVGNLTERNESLGITIARKYGYNGDGFVNRELFITENQLDHYGCIFKREAPIHTPITKELINNYLEDLIHKRKLKKRSPQSLKPQYIKRLGKNFRDSEGRIDRLYILYKVIGDINIAKRFSHRYAIHYGLEAPKTRTNKKDIDQYKLSDGDPNPEEILIEQEEYTIYLENREELYSKIQRLSGPEQRIIQQFLADEEYNQELFNEILEKLKIL